MAKLNSVVVNTLNELFTTKGSETHRGLGDMMQDAMVDLNGADIDTILAALEGVTPGNQVLVDTGAPSDANGNDGDIYINDANNDLYKKASGTWGSPLLNLTGATGATGASGNLNVFASTVRTATGSAENIAHGLSGTPTKVLVSIQDTNGVALPHAILEGAHDGTNVVVTVTASLKYKLLAIL